jgi:hypothetical protein
MTGLTELLSCRDSLDKQPKYRQKDNIVTCRPTTKQLHLSKQQYNCC